MGIGVHWVLVREVFAKRWITRVTWAEGANA